MKFRGTVRAESREELRMRLNGPDHQHHSAAGHPTTHVIMRGRVVELYLYGRTRPTIRVAGITALESV